MKLIISKPYKNLFFNLILVLIIDFKFILIIKNRYY